MNTLLLTSILVVAAPTADPELPALNTAGIEVGRRGTLGWHYGKVVQVMDDDWVLIALDNARSGKYVGYNVLLHAPGMGKVVADGKKISTGDWEKYLKGTPNVEVTGTKRLRNTLGATTTYYVLEKIK